MGNTSRPTGGASPVLSQAKRHEKAKQKAQALIAAEPSRLRSGEPAERDEPPMRFMVRATRAEPLSFTDSTQIVTFDY